MDNHPALNAFLILSLVELKAEETATFIEAAFKAKRVDTMVMGDWEDVQAELGLKPPPPPKEFSPMLSPSSLMQSLKRLQKMQEQLSEWDREEQAKIKAKSKGRQPAKKKKKRK